MAFVPISALPTAPSRTQPQAVFSANTDAFLTALPPLVTQINAGGAAIEASQSAASTSETNAATSETNAATSASGSASSANYVGLWSSLSGALNIPASVFHSDKVWSLKYNIANVAASQPGVSSDWVAVSFVVTTSATDTTAGRVTKVGDFGPGGVSQLEYPTNSIDVSTTPTGMYRTTSGNSGIWPSGFSVFGTMLVERYSTTEIKQTYFDIVSKRTAMRDVENNVPSGWDEIITAASTTAGTQITYGNAATQTFTRAAVNTYIMRHSAGAATYTLDASNFVAGDMIYVTKLFNQVGTLTITVTSGLIYLPDGSSANTQTLEAVGTICLAFDGGSWLARAA